MQPLEKEEDSSSEEETPMVGTARHSKTRKTRKYGTRAKVFHGGAEMTKGGLRKDDLVKNKYGRIVSVKKHKTMKQKHM
jgi:hypothetical protein